VAERLRAICGDLRLPILDDLGVGPALDWLVLRIEKLAGGEVRLERDDGARPPPDVELAFFRVAQEALANAVKHGRPPIVVRYRATPAGASLSIDDAGPGIAPEAGTVAERDGRFGLLNMQQRAEQIGAILDIRRWPAGGTHVALEWRPR
jgi:signal transduction histidine kinase